MLLQFIFLKFRITSQGKLTMRAIIHRCRQTKSLAKIFKHTSSKAIRVTFCHRFTRLNIVSIEWWKFSPLKVSTSWDLAVRDLEGSKDRRIRLLWKWAELYSDLTSLHGHPLRTFCTRMEAMWYDKTFPDAFIAFNGHFAQQRVPIIKLINITPSDT